MKLKKKDKWEIYHKKIRINPNISIGTINMYRIKSQNTKDRLPPYICLDNVAVWCLLLNNEDIKKERE